MSRAGRKSGGSGRTVTEDEAELWQLATRSLEPVKAKPRVAGASTKPPVQRPALQKEKQPPAQPPPEPRAPEAPRPPRGRSAPLAEFDRRKVRQIASGKIEIDARIDLHGLRQQDARARLRTFLHEAHAKGHRTVLVITGKGGEREPADHLAGALGEKQRGVLRRNVPLWLDQPELRAIVLSYTQAAVRHGGEGALYVQLRKSQRADR